LAVADESSGQRISRVIFEHAARISKEHDITTLVALNADLARDLVGADRCSLWLVDKPAKQLWTKVAHGVDKIRIGLGEGLVGACVRTGEIIAVNDTSSDERFLRRVDTESGYRTESVLVVPLRADGGVIGALQVLNKAGGFSESDAELLGFMASYSAAEIQAEQLRQEAEAVRLLRRELDIAREVQARLLPQALNAVQGLEYAGFCRPAKFVGGDYYDFLELRDGLFGLTLGDVSGKGIPAAMLMASIHMSLRSQLLREPLPLSRLMNELNAAVYRSSSVDRYTTLFCGVLDANRNTLTYVNAGQVAPRIARARNGAPIERLPGSGFPVGLLSYATYEQQTVEVEPGDILLGFSDGISEATNERDEIWNDDEVDGILKHHKNSRVDQIIDALVTAVDDYSAGTEQFDDMTVIAARIGAS
jgi:sigma-B regulation protein RsbU (phosphoserine phosphatase)